MTVDAVRDAKKISMPLMWVNLFENCARIEHALGRHRSAALITGFTQSLLQR